MKQIERYRMGWSDARSIFNDQMFGDYVEHKLVMTNWIPPRYAVLKYVNGTRSQTMASGVSLDTARGYIKLLKE